MTDPRSIDPTQVWVRHVIRGTEGQPTATALGRVFFVRADVVKGADGLAGREGWQAAQTTTVLEEDGSFQIELPNIAGSDGILHRERFKVFTDPAYQPGEEFLEFYRDPNDILFVGTPTDGEKTKSKVILTGKDLTVLLAGSLSSDVDVWDAAAPADVLHHYSRLPVLAHGDTTTYSHTTTTEGLEVFASAIASITVDPACWEAEARLTWESARPAEGGRGQIWMAVNVGGEPNEGAVLEVDVYEGTASILGESLAGVTGKLQGLVVPGPVALRLVARYDHLFAFVNGELIAEWRRQTMVAPELLTVWLRQGTATLRATQVTTLSDFANKGTIQRRLPGIPPATGLRAQYWNAAGIYAQHTEAADQIGRFWPLTGEEANVDRVEPTIDFIAGMKAPNMPGAYVARFSGAIYLDLATSNRRLKMGIGVGTARVYVGRTLRDEPILTTWTGGTTTSNTDLRGWLGESEAGWYPIVIEVTSPLNSLIFQLEDGVTGGSLAIVPQSCLSPIGIYSDIVRYTSHRQVIGDVAQSFGYQWRVVPRTLESGQFPGQLEARSLLGRQTNQTIREDDMGTEAQVQVAATDVVDGLTADAAGIANPKGSGQLSAQVVDYTRDHLSLRQGYESLADITEAPLLQTRLDSLLALRESPNEQVGVRPSGQRDLVDTFPLTGELAKLDWQPGDGVILELDAIDVKDQSPRQLTSVTWPLRPDGIGAPTVGFRSRPRSVRAAMLRLSRAIYAPRQNYQGSVAVVTGTVGGITWNNEFTVGGHDNYSRVPLPANLKRIVRAVAVVLALEGTGWRLEVTGVDLGSPVGLVPTVGRYDVTDVLAAQTPVSPYAFVRLIGGTSGYYTLTLELSVIV
jgi:hypothetical protein